MSNKQSLCYPAAWNIVFRERSSRPWKQSTNRRLRIILLVVRYHLSLSNRTLPLWGGDPILLNIYHRSILHSAKSFWSERDIANCSCVLDQYFFLISQWRSATLVFSVAFTARWPISSAKKSNWWRTDWWWVVSRTRLKQFYIQIRNKRNTTSA